VHRLILPLLALAACAPRPAPVSPGFRAADAPIYSSTIVEPAQLAGSWVQVATFASGGTAPCPPGQVDFAEGQVRWALCLADGMQSGQGPFVPGKPGRFAVAGMQDWWVLWVDADYRTLIIGTPSGDFGFVLNRQAQVPDDRVKAVRDILQFNGYSTNQLAAF